MLPFDEYDEHMKIKHQNLIKCEKCNLIFSNSISKYHFFHCSRINQVNAKLLNNCDQNIDKEEETTTNVTDQINITNNSTGETTSDYILKNDCDVNIINEKKRTFANVTERSASDNIVSTKNKKFNTKTLLNNLITNDQTVKEKNINAKNTGIEIDLTNSTANNYSQNINTMKSLDINKSPANTDYCVEKNLLDELESISFSFNQTSKTSSNSKNVSLKNNVACASTVTPNATSKVTNIAHTVTSKKSKQPKTSKISKKSVNSKNVPTANSSSVAQANSKTSIGLRNRKTTVKNYYAIENPYYVNEDLLTLTNIKTSHKNYKLKKYTCKYCEKKYSLKGPYMKHEEAHRKKSSSVKLHMSDETKNMTLQPIEIQNNDQNTDLINDDITEKQTSYCFICKKQFKHNRDLIDHNKIHFNIQCKNCDKIFNIENDFIAHEKFECFVRKL